LGSENISLVLFLTVHLSKFFVVLTDGLDDLNLLLLLLLLDTQLFVELVEVIILLLHLSSELLLLTLDHTKGVMLVG
jgi:hypothetical protein